MTTSGPRPANAASTRSAAAAAAVPAPGRTGTALVLSGGGARGAYQAGVVAGLVDVLGPRAHFDLFVGASAGALNAAFLAAHAKAPALAVEGLLDLWRSLRLRTHVRLSLCARGRRPPTAGSALLDARPIERLVTGGPAADALWHHLHEAIDDGAVRGLIIPALKTSDGSATIFAELAPQTPFHDWPARARTHLKRTRMTPEHVLASAAIPLLLPARLIDGDAYCDGGLRLLNPLSPAIRAGARRLVVVSLRSEGAPVLPAPAPPVLREIGNPLFLAGKVLDGLLLDPIDADLDSLERTNRLVDAFDAALSPEARRRLDEEIVRRHGAVYARVDALVFQPSVPLPQIAVAALDRLTRRAPLPLTSLLHELTRRAAHEEADLASFLLLDRELTEPLIELGRRDVHARRAEVLAFFGAGTGAAAAAAAE